MLKKHLSREKSGNYFGLLLICGLKFSWGPLRQFLAVVGSHKGFHLSNVKHPQKSLLPVSFILFEYEMSTDV